MGVEEKALMIAMKAHSHARPSSSLLSLIFSQHPVMSVNCRLGDPVDGDAELIYEVPPVIEPACATLYPIAVVGSEDMVRMRNIGGG